MMADIIDILNEKEVIFIFGYGSLTWKPDFEYSRRILGYIKGYERRFWQGSTYHRGTPAKPGRCLTLTKVEEGVCWGLIYEVRGEDKIAEALDYLNVREQKLGGYEVFVARVYRKNENDCSKPIYSVIYQATPECKGYLGDGTAVDLANDIATSIGTVGHNIEYLFRLSDFMREYLPEVVEDHLFKLDNLVREMVNLSTEDILPWKTLLLNENFKKIVKPIDYKAKWKQVIRASMGENHTIGRWSVLLDKIQNMSNLASVNLEKVDGNFDVIENE